MLNSPETNMILERIEDEILNDHYQQLVQTLETTKMNNVIQKGRFQIIDLAKKPSCFCPNHQKDYNLLFLVWGYFISYLLN